MIALNLKRKLQTALTAAAAMLICAGCGGGGGGDSAPQVAASVGTYSLISPASREVGTTPVTIASGGATLIASLPATTTVTVTERFYTAGRPAGVAGKVYDIKPDGLAFQPGTQFCISYDDISEYQPGELTIVTGEQLDQQIPSTVDAPRGRICASLQHSSPYGMARVVNLHTPALTFFGDAAATKRDFPPKVTATFENDDEFGSLSVTKIRIDCHNQCLEDGERTFKVIQSGTHAGDLNIMDDASYPLWTDMNHLEWMHFKNDSGAVVAGIPYLLAAEYMKVYGGGGLETYEAQLDPADNRIQRFFYYENQTTPYLYIEIIREDSTAPGVIRAEVNRQNQPKFDYVINRATAAITKSWISSLDGPHTVTAAPGDATYAAINQEFLNNIYVLVGMEDTPDYTTGNAWDVYPRYTPLQELFAVNVMNLMKGFGWNNIQQIEIYYRDRLKAIQDPAH
jgi:hypothetical protein